MTEDEARTLRAGDNLQFDRQYEGKPITVSVFVKRGMIKLPPSFSADNPKWYIICSDGYQITDKNVQNWRKVEDRQVRPKAVRKGKADGK